MQVDELLKIYKKVFSLKNGYKRTVKLHKVVLFFVILTGAMGAALIIISIFFKKIIFLAIVLYFAFCVIVSLVIQFILKRKYNDVHYLEKESNAEFIDEIYQTLNLDFRDDRVLNTIEDYLNFHWKKEKNKLSFLTLFKPGMSWMIIIFPILLSYYIKDIDHDVMYFLGLFSIYILAFILISNAVKLDRKNRSKDNLIMGVLEILSEQKIINLRRDLAIDVISLVLSNGNFNKLSEELLIEAGYQNIVEQNMSQYISSLNSIKNNIDEKKLQKVINDCNHFIEKKNEEKYK